MPKVSVVIPVYGVEKYIERCCRSLFEQTLDDIEFLFVDDCTPDNSIGILNEVLLKYPNRWKQTRIVRMPTNSGLAVVRRQGILEAKGDYIIHCDSDDWVESAMCEEMWEKASQEDLDIVVCDYYRSDGSNHKIIKKADKTMYQDRDTYFPILIKGHVSTAIWNKLIRRDIYFDNDIVYPICNMWEDFVLNIQLTYYSKSIGYIDVPFYYYYDNQSSICYSKIEQRISQVLENSKLILNFLTSKKLDKIYEDELLSFKYYSRSELDLYVSERKYRRMWRHIYPEINAKYCFSNSIPFREKLKFISIYCGVYPMIIRCIRILKK